MFPQKGPLWKNTLVSTALLNLCSRVSSKGALPPGSPNRAPTESYVPCPALSFIYLAEVRGNTSPISHKICTVPLRSTICFKGTCVFSWWLNFNCKLVSSYQLNAQFLYSITIYMLQCSPLSTGIPYGRLQRVTITDAVIIQFDLLKIT